MFFTVLSIDFPCMSVIYNYVLCNYKVYAKENVLHFIHSLLTNPRTKRLKLLPWLLILEILIVQIVI